MLMTLSFDVRHLSQSRSDTRQRPSLLYCPDVPTTRSVRRLPHPNTRAAPLMLQGRAGVWTG